MLTVGALLQMASYQAAAEEMQAYMLQYKAIADAHMAALDPSFHLRTVSLPPLSLGELQTPDLPSPRQYRAEFAEWAERVLVVPRHRLSEAIVESTALAASLDGHLRELPSAFGSYHPPPLNASQAVEEMGASVNSYLDEQVRALDAIGAEFEGAEGASRSHGANPSNATTWIANMLMNWSMPALEGSDGGSFAFEPLKGAAAGSIEFVQVNKAERPDHQL